MGAATAAWYFPLRPRNSVSTTALINVHEAYPGHYVQFLCLNASRATKLEKIFSGYAFTEGWAHYAEQMLVDEGFSENLQIGRAHV